MGQRSTYKVITRGSRLALAQTRLVVSALQAANSSLSFEIVSVTTKGDRVTDRPLATFRGTGVFVKELERALLDGEADIAVHSLKDVPTASPEGLVLSSFPERADPRDVILTRTGGSLGELRPGSVIGTSSPRRMLQLAQIRPDLRFSDIRGNLDTRIEKMQSGDYDAIILAAAGMMRLGKTVEPTQFLPVQTCIPAVGQGVLALQVRADDGEAAVVTAGINHSPTACTVGAERHVLQVIGGGCALPLGALAKISENRITIEAAFGDPNRRELVRVQDDDDSSQWRECADRVAHHIIEWSKEKGVSLA